MQKKEKEEEKVRERRRKRRKRRQEPDKSIYTTHKIAKYINKQMAE